MQKEQNSKYYIIAVEDVNELLLFGKKPEGDFQDEIKEDKRIE